MRNNVVKQFLASLEKMGEEKVREEHAKLKWGKPGDIDYILVDNWLLSKASEREVAAVSRAEAREETALSISEEANRIASDALAEARSANSVARRANRIAIIALIIAATAVI